jgi:hypothetical protein
MQMLNQVHASNCVHGLVRPGELLSLQVRPLELASGRILLGFAGTVSRIESKVRTQFGHMPERFPVR